MTTHRESVSPERAQKLQDDANVSSRTRHARVAINMEEHILRAELYHQSHKKLHSALQMESHQLGESVRFIEDVAQRLYAQQVDAKRHSDALPPYDSSSHMAMQAELVELAAGISTLEALRSDVLCMMRDVNRSASLIDEEMHYIQSIVARDKFITSSEAPPSVKDPKLWMALTTTRKVHESLPDIYDRGSSASAVSPRSKQTTPSPRAAAATAAAAAPAGTALGVGSGRLNGVNWPGVIAQSYTSGNELIKESNALVHRADTVTKNLLTRCQSLRSKVVSEQNHAIEVKIRQRQRWIVELDALESKLFEVRRVWRTTSEQVKRMKEPLTAADARHSVRETVDDSVGRALVDERSVIAKQRHELKKVCRSLAEQVDELEAEKNRKQQELLKLDAELRTDRRHCSVEDPTGVFQRPHPIKVTAIRTYPHLLHTQKLFGSSSSVSPRRTDSRERRSATPQEHKNLELQQQALVGNSPRSTPSPQQQPASANGLQVVGATSNLAVSPRAKLTAAAANHIPAPPARVAAVAAA